MTTMFDGAPLVTVYLPCRNYGAYLARAIASVREQVYPHWELLVFDEASDDDSLAIAQHHAREDDRIKVFHNESPQGLQRIANRALELAQGRYIVRLDADDWFDESALLVLVAKMETDDKLGLVFGNYYYTAPDGRVLGMERRRKLGDEDASGNVPPHGACTMVRTRVLKAVGGYSEDVNAQDGWELWYKLLHRTQVASIDTPVFYYRQHEQSLSRDADRLLSARAKIMDKARSRIDGSYRPSCLAVIPVKADYPGFPGVPFETIGKRSLLEWAVRSAQGAEGVTAVAVSTDDERVLEFSERLEGEGRVGPHLRLRRPPELSGSHIRLREILVHAGERYRELNGVFPDVLAFLSLHAPLRRAEHVDKALNVLRIGHSDSVVSVIEEGEPMFTPGRDGLELLNPGRFEEVAYERERLYRFNGAIIAAWWEVLAGGDIFGKKVGYIEMSKDVSMQIKGIADLDSPRFKALESQIDT